MKLRPSEENCSGQGIKCDRNKFSLCLLILCVSVIRPALSQQMVSAPEPQTATIIGTVLDVNEGTVPGATVVLEGPTVPGLRRVETNDNGFFEFGHVKPGSSYHVTVGGKRIHRLDLTGDHSEARAISAAHRHSASGYGSGNDGERSFLDRGNGQRAAEHGGEAAHSGFHPQFLCRV